MKASQRAWLKHYGFLPDCEIDHIDRDPSNNSIENLRLCSRSQNNQNRRGWGFSGEKNVTFMKSTNKWQIKVKAGSIYVRQYASHKLSAILAARLIRRELHGEFAYQGAA